MTTTQQTYIDLQSLIEQHAPTRLQKVATSHGGEYAGMCPWCGGNDRFRVWPFSERAHYWCRSCQRSGDHVQFLRDYCNMSFVEACAELGIEPGDTISHAAPMFFDDDPPCKKWQEMAELVVLSAEKYLWNKAPHALEYLRKRGFNDETIQTARLGYVPLTKDGTWYQRPFEMWGLTDDMLSEKQKQKGSVKVPPGILIPWYTSGQPWKLAIKRFEASEKEMRYGQVVGSKDALYNADALQRNKPVVLVEGEFDTLSIVQSARDLVAPIATGSAAKKAHIPLWIAKLASFAKCTLVSFDSDAAGDTASKEWLNTLPNSMRWIPFSHDCNDMLKEGKSIRKWLELGLSLMEKPPVEKEEQPLQGSTEDGLSLVCSQCGDPVDYYNEKGTAFCEQHWPQPPAQPANRYCKQCKLETIRDNPDELCALCWWRQFSPVEPPKEPYTVKNAWL